MQTNRRNILKGVLTGALFARADAWGAGMTDIADSAAAMPAVHGHKAGAALGTGATIDPAGRLWIAQLDGTGDAMLAVNIVLRSTIDGGKTWSEPVSVLRAPEPIEASGESRPKLAFGPRGELYISYTRPLAKPYTGDIRFVRSLDGGRTFSEPLTVQRDLAVRTHRFDSLIVDPQGRVFVAWIDKRDAEGARTAGAPYRGAAIYYAVSSNAGASFAPDVRAAEHSCECCRIALALDPGGRVTALWRHVFEPDVRDHACVVLPPHGVPAAIQRASFDEWHIDACPHHGPALAFAPDGTRHQVWFDAADDDGGVFYAAAIDGRMGKPVRLGSAQAEHGDVAAFGTSVVLAWKEFDGESTVVHTRSSGDGGRRWTEATLLRTRGSSDHVHLLHHGNVGWLVWRTVDEGVIVQRVGGAT
jgi:hypothetical protein